MHYNYEIFYQPGDKNSAVDALSHKEEHKPDQPNKTFPTALFDPKQFVEIAYLALLDQLPMMLETNEASHTLTDK